MIKLESASAFLCASVPVGYLSGWCRDWRRRNSFRRVGRSIVKVAVEDFGVVGFEEEDWMGGGGEGGP